MSKEDKNNNNRVPVGPTIIGEHREKFWVGNLDEEGEAACLELTATPEQALQLFAKFAQAQSMKGKGIPPPFVLSWIFTSKGLQGAFERIAELEKRVDELEKSD